MDAKFLEGCQGLGVPLHPIDAPFEGKTLPGFFLEHDATARPLIMVVGGGDTFREDLFYFGGYPAGRRGYNALMVDLPGQGICPARGLTFRANMAGPISAVLDFLSGHAACPPEKVAIYGLSGGGFFTAQAAATDRRIGAWIASTPITNIADLFGREFGAATHVPGPLLRLAVSALGAVNKGAELSLKEYAWQFGTTDFKLAVDQVLVQARSVEPAAISCPCLFLIGESEAEELKSQALGSASDLKRLGRD